MDYFNWFYQSRWIYINLDLITFEIIFESDWFKTIDQNQILIIFEIILESDD